MVIETIIILAVKNALIHTATSTNTATQYKQCPDCGDKYAMGYKECNSWFCDHPGLITKEY